MCKKKGEILFTLKSPYMVGDVDTLEYDGELQKCSRVMALCRCGGSNNMPFCDGTHSKNGFNGEKERSDSKVLIKNFEGDKISIFFNARLCAHVGRCLKLKSVFSKESKPWINPNGASVEKIVETIQSCPSGALSYQLKGCEKSVEYKTETKIVIKKGGPLCVEGGIRVVDNYNSDKAVETLDHYTLCRCGKSKNKPLCDGTHHDEKFNK